MFLPKTSFDQESLESVGKKDNHSKFQVGRVQMLIAFKFFSLKCQSIVPERTNGLWFYSENHSKLNNKNTFFQNGKHLPTN